MSFGVKMTVKQLKALIADAPDDMVLVTEGSDHSFSNSTAVKTEAWKYPDGDLSEYYGPEYNPGGPGKIIKVLLIN